MWGVKFTKTLAEDLNEIYGGYEVALSLPECPDYQETLPKELAAKGLSCVILVPTCGYPIRKYTVDEHF